MLFLEGEDGNRNVRLEALLNAPDPLCACICVVFLLDESQHTVTLMTEERKKKTTLGIARPDDFPERPPDSQPCSTHSLHVLFVLLLLFLFLVTALISTVLNLRALRRAHLLLLVGVGIGAELGFFQLGTLHAFYFANEDGVCAEVVGGEVLVVGG